MKKRVSAFNPGNIVGIIFLLVGLGLLVGGIATCISGVKYKQTADEVVGTIVEIESHFDMDGDRDYDVYVEYKYMAREYEALIGYYSSSMDVGDEILLYIQPDRPERPKAAAGLSLVYMILLFMGAVFSLVGGSFVFGSLMKRCKGKKIMQAGRRIYAEVTGGRICYEYAVNGRHPFKLECKYIDVFSGEAFLYSSDYMWENPELYVGQQVVVYVLPNDMGKYYVDLESLQNPISESGSVVHDFR